MPIEVANYVNQLVATNPTSNDPKAEGDDHLRLLKTVLTQTFPNVGGAVTLTHTQINDLVAAVAAAVTLTGDQTIAGVKTFSSSPVLPGNATTALQAVPKQQLDLVIPAGAVLSFAMNYAPSGWLKANGVAVSRTTYAALFAAIGTTYGAGNGSTTFNIPDLRGEFIRGFDDGKGIDSGRVFGSSQSSANLSHSHKTDGTDDGNEHAVRLGADGAFDFASQTASVNDMAYITGSITGASGESEARPRNIALLYCIKT